jgi:hypothetical protein
MLYLATLCPSWGGDLRLLDATPVPCGTSRETVRRSDLAGWAKYGYYASHLRWYWGLKLYLLATPGGMPVAWCLADPKLGERDVAVGLLAHVRDLGALREGTIVLAGQGLAGREMERYAADQVKGSWPARTAKTSGTASATWLECGNGSKRSSTPSKTSSAWSDTVDAPPLGFHPHRPAAAGPGRRHLAQLTDRCSKQAIPDRLRPLNALGITHLGLGDVKNRRLGDVTQQTLAARNRVQPHRALQPALHAL